MPTPTRRLPSATPARRQAGMSMVELMVAMVIALVGTVIIFQVFEVSEGIKRTTTSGGDAQQNGVIGLYVMERDLRNAGMGFNDTAYSGCTVLAYDTARSPQNFSFRMVPALITPGATAAAPDSLTVFYGSQNTVASSTTISANMAAATDALRVASRYGYRTGDLIMVVEPGTAKNCSLSEVTGLPSANSDQVNHAAGVYSLDWVEGGAVNKTARMTNGGALSEIYAGVNTANVARVFNIGNLYDKTGTHAVNGANMPVLNTYSITGNNLAVASGFSTAAATPFADNVVHMRAMYGLDDGVGNATVTGLGTPTAGDGIIDRYVDAATFNALSPVPWQYIVAIRVAIVARSALPEKGSGGPGSACDTTTAAPTWSGSAFASPHALAFRTELALTADASWQCYRYKTFESTIPLRNWIWKSS